MKTPTTVWRISTTLIAALDERLGDPVDAYVNGSQTWLIDNGPGAITLEWRLHPVAGYERPQGIDTYAVVRAAADERVDAATLWDGLEAFAAYDDVPDVDELRAVVTDVLGIPPDVAGGVDHDVIGDEWEKADRRISIVDRLFAQLTA